jgi:hypothetical protein
MERLINKNSKGELLDLNNKIDSLIDDGAILLEDPPKIWEEGVVCVFDNDLDEDDVHYCYDQSELDSCILNEENGRFATWMKYEHASSLAQ